MRILALIACIFFYRISLAQTLIAEGTPPDLYITHTVAAKENYYSIGRMYNISPKDLAPYNNLTFENGLSLGQTLKIPLNIGNFTQGTPPNENEVLIPVYHITKAKEGLYRVSVNYNKVPLDALRKWNKLTSDAVGTGTKLIIGFLKVQKDQSPLASQAVSVNMQGVAVKKPEEKKPVVTNNEPVKEPEPKVKKPVSDEPIENSSKTPINFNGGKFKSLYQDQVKDKALENQVGTAGIFKTTSGWQDGKYYCFHNNAEPGTIIKITNTANGRSVYAKVLDAIPDIKQNAGLLLRVSNSAAEELGVTDTKFDCSIAYAK